MKVLHILNGDSTLEKFRDSSLPGDVVVWREVLSEGPVNSELSLPEFFTMRSKWIGEAFKASQSDYHEKVTKEFQRIQLAHGYDEIVLWFEFDLHCQINLLFLLNFFSGKEAPETTLQLICPASHPNHPDFRGIGELSPEELAALFPVRIRIVPDTLAFASTAWQVYCSQNKGLLKHFLNNNFGQLALLKPALVAHLDRIREPGSPITPFEQKLINLVNSCPKSRIEVYKAFWKNSSIYGMGDAEIDLYLDSLAKQNLIPFIEPI